MADPRFLLGFGERLSERVPPPPGGGGPDPAYSFEDAVTRLAPRLASAVSILGELPPSACPNNEAVSILTLHPQSVAKSYHPRLLLSQYGLRQVGSRPTTIEPQVWTKKSVPTPSPTTELFVAGDRGAFADWASDLTSDSPVVNDSIRRLEDVRAPSVRDVLRLGNNEPDSHLTLEVVLHARNSANNAYIIEAFAQYTEEIGVQASLDKRLYAGGLCFLPIEADLTSMAELSRFSFLRTARPIPRMREIAPIERSTPSTFAPAQLPSDDSVDPDLRIAVFDGGLAPGTPLAKWTTSVEPPGVSAPVPGQLDHGHDVTSALLFGSLVPGEAAPTPYGVVDHFRVLDDKAGSDPFELYDVLRRIQNVLSERRYEFFNLSLGPASPVEDDEVHPWTAMLDEHLSDGHALATLAVGNTGRSADPAETRIQIPGDAVNGFAIGASDSIRTGWARAPYSSIGPGRSPGVIKPDVMGFGGSGREPFMVYDSLKAPKLSTTAGTSFSAPAVLRLATGVRAHFGDRLSALGIKALLIHSSVADDYSSGEVGWGKVPETLESLVTCSESAVRVVYQGELTPSQYLRALIPLPETPLRSLVTLKATIVYATAVDPEDPGSYTRSGLDVTFRPHSQKFKNEDSVDPKTRPFFQRSAFDPEATLRHDAHKWETVMRKEVRMQGRSLHDPVFDIHYNARQGGGAPENASKIRYALVVDISCVKAKTLYDDVARTFAGRLEALRPRVEIPLAIGTTAGP